MKVPPEKMSKPTADMSDLCKKVLEKLEAYSGNCVVSRVEEETHFDDFQHFSDAVEKLNLPEKAEHMVDLDDTADWAMSGDSNTLGNLCIAFKNADDSITLLREVCEKNKAGVPYLSEAWLPEYNFTKQSPVSLDEQERFLQMRYYDGSLSKPLVFRYVYLDDEEDEKFKKPDEHTQALLDAGKLRRNADGDYITCPPSEWKERCHNLECDLAVAVAERDMADKKAMEQDEAIQSLIAQGLLSRDASGDLVFQRIEKPYVIGKSHRL